MIRNFITAAAIAACAAIAPAAAETAPGALIGDGGTLVSATPLGVSYLQCIKNTPQITNWACWFQYPAVIDRDYRIE